MTRGPRTSLRTFAAFAVPLVAAAAAAAADLAATREAQGAATFRRLTAGAGGGPAIDLSSCAAAFDPREADGCPDRFEPAPCGDVLCPRLGADHREGADSADGTPR